MRINTQIAPDAAAIMLVEETGEVLL